MNDDKYKKIEFLFISFIIFLWIYYMYLAHNTQMLGEDEASYFSLANEFMEFNYSSNPYVVFPFISLFYTPFFLLLGSSLSLAKMIIAFFGFLTVIMIYLFCKKLSSTSFFGINIFGLASISIIFTINYFTHFMLLSYTEIPIAFFSILSLYILLNFRATKDALFLGTIFGISFLIKSVAIIFPIILFLFFLAKYIYNKDKNSFKLFLISCVMFALIIVPFVLRNLILFNYPYVEGLNIFFKSPLVAGWGTTEITKLLSVSADPFSIFGYIALFLSIFGILYFLEVRDEKMFLTLFVFLSFTLVYYLRSFLGIGIGDPRYFSIIFPQIAIIGGYYLTKIADWKKNFSFLIIIFFTFAIFTSYTVALSTSQSQRYPDNYIEALNWVKTNTPKDALIFTTYGGSLSYFGERKNVWSLINEFPEIMTTTNSTRIYEILKNYNVSYILVWRGTLAENYIVPESNLIGAFTFNFLNQVYNDKQHFNLTFSNQDNFIFKVL